jgi:hypothetical protein
MTARPLGAVDRTPKPCHHPRANHQHGTRACYVHDHCRCYPCGAANSNYAAELNRQTVYGRSNLVDAEPVREHIRQLMAGGMGRRTIADRAGLSESSVVTLLYGRRRPDGTRRPPSRRIRADVAQKLHDVRLELAEHALVDSTGTVRRIRALIALGWSQAKLADLLGITPQNFWFPAAARPRVLSSTARAVRELYDDLSMKHPPEDTPAQRAAASRARSYAAARRWVPPLAWDDDKIDDPAAHKPKRFG